MNHLLNLGGDAWLTLAVVVLILVGLVREWLGPDVLLTAGVMLLTICGVIDPARAFEGFANHAVLAVAGLFVVARAVEQSGVLDRVTHWVLDVDPDKRKPSASGATARVMLATAGLSSVLNNTPVVVMLAPAVRRFALARGISPKQLLIPVSYAAMLGGMCTLIGTSTNLVVAGMMVSVGLEGFGMFELAQLGLPVALVGILFMTVFGPRLLPRTLEPAPVATTVPITVVRPPPPPPPAPRHGVLAQPWVVITVMAAMIVIPTVTSVPLIVSVFGAAAILLIGKAVTPQEARASLDLEVFVTIAMAFGLGAAMTQSGLAGAIGQMILAPAGQFGPIAVVAAVFIATSMFTEVITNNAAAVLMFPIVTTVAGELDMDPRRLLLVVTIAASCSFATPLGYQTNMIVAKLGDYRFIDFARVGIGMNLAALLTTVLVASLFWF